MRCKYERVLFIIHQQLNRESKEGDVFIVLSKDMRKVRLFSYDHRSYSLFAKRFTVGYKFMQVIHEGRELIYSIDWWNVVLFLENPVVKRLYSSWDNYSPFEKYVDNNKFVGMTSFAK